MLYPFGHYYYYCFVGIEKLSWKSRKVAQSSLLEVSFCCASLSIKMSPPAPTLS